MTYHRKPTMIFVLIGFYFHQHSIVVLYIILYKIHNYLHIVGNTLHHAPEMGKGYPCYILSVCTHNQGSKIYAISLLYVYIFILGGGWHYRVPTREWMTFFGYNQPVSAELEAARR